MPGWLTSALAIVRSILGLAERQQAYAHDEAEQQVGAMAQREADQKATLKTREDQLEKAANHRPGDAARKLRDGTL